MFTLAAALLLAALPAPRDYSPPRDPQARAAFVRAVPCPATGRHRGACPGWAVDHVVPLCAGGADAPHNMQWLTVEQHAVKTQRDRAACRPQDRGRPDPAPAPPLLPAPAR